MSPIRSFSRSDRFQSGTLKKIRPISRRSNADLSLAIEDTEEVNELLVDAIRAKLALLDKLDSWG